jgi:ferrochelatase
MTGVLLINLGTPASPAVGDVRRYLREFLSDPRVIDVPAALRWALVNLWIAPTRAPRSARQYAGVWGEAGSPLRVHSLALREALGQELGSGFRVALGMRYGQPSIAAGLDELLASGVSRLIALPLYPQYASSSTGTAVEALYAAAGAKWNTPTLEVLPEFYEAPGFVAALAALARPVFERARPDHLLMSYHGLPERQVRKSTPDSTSCLRDAHCCEAIRADNARCYRAQCFATSRALAGALELTEDRWSISFQSRLGRTPWIRPFTDEVLPQLAARGIKRLAVTCPSFAADCLETVEEIGVRAREQWRACGGAELELVPCPNAHPVWVQALAGWIRARVESASAGKGPARAAHSA